MVSRHAQPVALVELEATRLKRRRAAQSSEWPVKPLGLSADERALLRDWVEGGAAACKWEKLRQIAGVARLELADRLANRLLPLGVWTTLERFERAAWRCHEITWSDLPAVQRELGLATDADRLALRTAADGQLFALLADELVGEAAGLVLASRVTVAVKQARADLLGGLSSWVAGQRTGVRQDFALHARPHTKAVTTGEWDWLGQHFDLASLGIGRFKPLLWLAGDSCFRWPKGNVSLHPLPLVGLPCEVLDSLAEVLSPPSHYWLIENRASFERQADTREPGCCLIWTAGRPSHAWLRAVAALLQRAPAPAFVSADADPAGVEIAWAATQPWRDAGLSWEPRAMTVVTLQTAKRLPLNAYDVQCVQRLQLRADLPSVLVDLVGEMLSLQGKAEQEGWL